MQTSRGKHIIDLTAEVEKRVLQELNELSKYDGRNLRNKILLRRLQLKEKLAPPKQEVEL